MSTAQADTAPYYGPVNVTDGDVLFEKCYIQGAILGGIAYGAEFVLFAQIVITLFLKRSSSRTGLHGHSSLSNTLTSTSKPRSLRSRLPDRTTLLILYVALIFLFNTLWMVSNMRWVDLMFIDNRNYPGGPLAWNNTFFSLPISDLGNVTFVLAAWFADGVMLWRTMVIWRTSYVKLVMTIPSLIYIASIITSILTLLQLTLPGLSLWTRSAINVALPFFILSLSLNIVLTLLIGGRLLYFSYSVSSVLGRKYGRKYEQIASVVVESALIYAVFATSFLALYVSSSAVQHVFLQCLSQAQACATFLIILRVLNGTAFTTRHVTTGDSKTVFSNLSFKRTRDTEAQLGSVYVSRTIDVEASSAQGTASPNHKARSLGRPSTSETIPLEQIVDLEGEPRRKRSETADSTVKMDYSTDGESLTGA